MPLKSTLSPVVRELGRLIPKFGRRLNDSLDPLHSAHQTFRSTRKCSSCRRTHIIEETAVLRVSPDAIVIKLTVHVSILIGCKHNDEIL